MGELCHTLDASDGTLDPLITGELGGVLLKLLLLSFVGFEFIPRVVGLSVCVCVCVCVCVILFLIFNLLGC